MTKKKVIENRREKRVRTSEQELKAKEIELVELLRVTGLSVMFKEENKDFGRTYNLTKNLRLCFNGDIGTNDVHLSVCIIFVHNRDNPPEHLILELEELIQRKISGQFSLRWSIYASEPRLLKISELVMWIMTVTLTYEVWRAHAHHASYKAKKEFNNFVDGLPHFN